MFRRLPGIDRDTDVADAMQTYTGPTGRKPNIQPIATDIAYLPAPTCDLQAWKPRSIFYLGIAALSLPLPIGFFNLEMAIRIPVAKLQAKSRSIQFFSW